MVKLNISLIWRREITPDKTTITELNRCDANILRKEDEMIEIENFYGKMYTFKVKAKATVFDNCVQKVEIAKLRDTEKEALKD